MKRNQNSINMETIMMDLVVLCRYGIHWHVPDPPEREKIDRIIFSELVNGIFTEQSRGYFNSVSHNFAYILI